MEVSIIIALLTAIANYAKDIHYNCKGDAAYSKHLLADLLQDDLYDFIDDIKENVLLGGSQLPLPSKTYLAMAVQIIPEISLLDCANFQFMLALINKTRALLSVLETNSRGANALFDNIAEHLDKCAGLLFLQLRKVSIVESEKTSFKKEECECAVEKAIDRAKAVVKDFDRDKVAQTILGYEGQNVLVAEEKEEVNSALSRVAKKLGV